MHSSQNSIIEPFLLPIYQLSENDQKEMFFLLQIHFEGVSWQQFLADLNGKNWAILLKREGSLKGFSTLQFYETKLDKEPARVVYSGDTITDPSMWSNPILSQAWIRAIQEIHRGHSEKLYWLLISSGYRTYRFLSTFFRTFYPHYNYPTPPEFLAFIHHIAGRQFQECYDPVTGLVRFPNPQILSPELRSIAPEKLKDPHVAFFAEKNAGYINGDELVCLTEISEKNLTRAGLRMWKTRVLLQIPFPIEMTSQ